jgi:hypothetical protein
MPIGVGLMNITASDTVARLLSTVSHISGRAEITHSRSLIISKIYRRVREVTST